MEIDDGEDRSMDEEPSHALPRFGFLGERLVRGRDGHAGAYLRRPSTMTRSPFSSPFLTITRFWYSLPQHYGAQGHLVLRGNHVDHLGGLLLHHGPPGRQKGILDLLSGKTDAGELIGSQESVGVGKLGHHAEGAGLDIHRTVRHHGPALVRIDTAVGQDEFHIGGAG